MGSRDVDDFDMRCTKTSDQKVSALPYIPGHKPQSPGYPA